MIKATVCGINDAKMVPNNLALAHANAVVMNVADGKKLGSPSFVRLTRTTGLRDIERIFSVQYNKTFSPPDAAHTPIGLPGTQRADVGASPANTTEVDVEPYTADLPECAMVTLAVRLLTKPAEGDTPEVDTEALAQVLTKNVGAAAVGQMLFAQSGGMNYRLRVESMADAGGANVPVGAFPDAPSHVMIMKETIENMPGTSKAQQALLRVTLTGTNSLSGQTNVFSSKFDFESFGVGGLDAEIFEIFRDVLISRMSPDKQLKYSHVKGLILYGPPGTGKTLLARQFSEFLSAKTLSVVNGPELLNKYVGQSEENIRNLFQPAKDDKEANGDDAGLHVIVFDEIDSLFRQRGGQSDNTGVKDGIVNQLLTEMDGVNSPDNILVIGMTNRVDLLDPAMLRPGRFSLKVAVRLADRQGRADIFRIHTKAMREIGRFVREDVTAEEADVVIDRLAEATTNFTGAEIKQVVDLAKSRATLEALMPDAEDGAVLTVDALSRLTAGPARAIVVTERHLLDAVRSTVPQFGSDYEKLRQMQRFGWADFPYLNTAIDACVKDVNSALADWTDKIVPGQDADATMLPLVVHGARGAGKSAFASRLAQSLGIEFVKVVDLSAAPAQAMRALDDVMGDAVDARKAVIVVDAFEQVAYGENPLKRKLGEFMAMKTLPMDKAVLVAVILVTHTESLPDTLAFLRDQNDSVTADMHALHEVRQLTTPDDIRAAIQARAGRITRHEGGAAAWTRVEDAVMRGVGGRNEFAVSIQLLMKKLDRATRGLGPDTFDSMQFYLDKVELAVAGIME